MRTKAVHAEPMAAIITGQGHHHGVSGMTDNIVHLVLTRLPDAPAGVKGISLFVVPKFLVNADGSLGAHNDVRCVVDRAQTRHPWQPDGCHELR